MPLDLPYPVAAYFAADASRDPDTLARSFVADGVVRDEGETHVGADAIIAWWREARARYRFDNEPLDAFAEDGRLVVRARVTGDFPGSPAALRFAFTLSPEGIRRLEIGA